MQRRVLVRARGLASFRRALVDFALTDDPLTVRRRAIIVPTRAAGALLRLTLEQEAAARGRAALLCPDMLTRDEWLASMLATLSPTPRWLGRIERLVLFERAMETTRRRPGLAVPFEVRPGLAAAMLDFYDQLRRRQRRVRAFARTIFDELRVERGTDRGSERLIEQTRFLGYTFLAYERAATASGGVDEHELVGRLLEQQPTLEFDHLVVAVADHPADPRGLWPVDFDLIGRLQTLADVSVVMTDEAHDAGFRDRIEQQLPGIVEHRAADVLAAPHLIVDAGDASDGRVPVAISRDREEELRDVARHIRARAEQHDGTLAGTTAIVFHRPLPYLYLAQQVLADAGIPFRVFDALPLAAEPYAALLDLALAVARTGGARETVMELVRSPLARFVVDGVPVSPADVQELDLLLTERRTGGPASEFAAEVAAWLAAAPDRRATRAARLDRAARAAAAAARDIAGCRTATTAAAQVRCLESFLRAVERPAAPLDAGGDRFPRARAAVLGVLQALADAFERHDNRARTHDALAAAIYHAIEDQTFAPARGDGGVHLVDAAAARFGDFDEVFLVGLVETDWAERPGRNFFYSAGLLKALGWPQDADQSAAARAAFRDVLTLARQRTRLSAFQLDGESVVALSTMIDAAGDMPILAEPAPLAAPLFPDEVLTRDDGPARLDGEARRWLLARRARPALDSPAYGGFVPATFADAYRVSQVDRYVTCPFKYFAAHVLRLPEERPDAVGLTPLERGTLLHTLFERFYARWQQSGHGAVTYENMPEALALFEDVTTAEIQALPEADRALERLRVLGSVVAPGVADRALDVEASAPDPVVGRHLEVPMGGPFTFPVKGGLSSRNITIRGKADRVDVLGDGSLRVVDYKLGRMPDAASLQVAVYAHCIRQVLEREDGRVHPVSVAMYMAFGDDYRLDGRLAGTASDVDVAVTVRAGQFADVVGRMEEGAFPPRPLRTSDCQWCGYAGVCRKEYRIEDGDAAEPV